jgi:hypothetical protein
MHIEENTGTNPTIILYKCLYFFSAIVVNDELNYRPSFVRGTDLKRATETRQGRRTLDFQLFVLFLAVRMAHVLVTNATVL